MIGDKQRGKKKWYMSLIMKTLRHSNYDMDGEFKPGTTLAI